MVIINSDFDTIALTTSTHFGEKIHRSFAQDTSTPKTLAPQKNVFFFLYSKIIVNLNQNETVVIIGSIST